MTKALALTLVLIIMGVIAPAIVFEVQIMRHVAGHIQHQIVEDN